MTKIKILDKLTIQKIAAGEVIENPASIVKELIENSIDANSKNIIIEIKNGGKDYIRITDDGEGMTQEDLSIAFERHSTSKLEDIEDIYNIVSLGFRGEALSSISNVAKVEILTKTKDSSVGTNAFVEEGKVISIDNVGSPIGTTMIVKDLFYNLPVRKKFLKSSRSESNNINNIINRLALGNNKVSFRFIRDNKTILQTNKTNDLLDTIYTILGEEFSDNFIPINYQDEYIKISGFISNNKLYRGNRSHQYLYVNNRSVENLIISKTVEHKYKSLIPLNRFPIFVLNIDLDPGQLDINMHPTKQEIKFVDQEKVMEKINNIIDNNLFRSINIPNIKFNKEKTQIKDNRTKLFELNKNNKENSTEDFIIKDFSTNFDSKQNVSSRRKKDPCKYTNENCFNNKTYKEQKTSKIQEGRRDPKIKIIPEESIKEQTIKDNLLDIDPIGRIFNTYILAESKIDEKLFIIDQHAAHERIMYEKYKREYENEEIITQQLLYPEIIELTHSEMSKFQKYINVFQGLGFDLEEFGPSSVALRGVPLIFGTPQSKGLFIDILDNLDKNIKSNYDTKLDKIMKLACSNSIKSGDKINSAEIMGLFKDLKDCNNPFTCPHGRPTMIEITKRDIEKEFLRIN